ncbi:NHL repeat-containing protein 2 [Drosophila kikkawai]|uniref:NHL repeat-containing protein 2 n=1 Tax=Drosophila kikkawai TaxID=30033 RepID=A0A6P4J0X9_DROKI|nr:NHL repeat-containing protein 2 [Drosophila kikkawai]
MEFSADLPFIDILTYITNELQQTYKNSNEKTEKVKVLNEFFERWDNDNSIKILKSLNFEFEPDLDWFNVSRPLSLAGLRGKIVVLDFFTYCCINCIHILPELHSLEEQFPIDSGLVVVGVHSPKFENERATVNIQSAVHRYGITHPIVNDTRSALWSRLGIRCWPSLMVLSPTGRPLLILMGEGHGKFLEEFIGAALLFFQKLGKIDHGNLPLELSSNFYPASNLRFPAKITRSPRGDKYAIADSGNNRILVVTKDGVVEHKIGGYQAGFADGNLITARFNSPQGVAFIDENVLIVADTKNHCLRKICLTNKQVDTLAGTGVQGSDRIGGRIGNVQPISSPWDVAIFRTRDMDMSFHLDELNVPEKPIVLISMAGTHQIWGYFPEGIIWWKFRKFEPLCCVALIGNGLEENRNNSYPQNAAFAQPSGLAMAKDYLFIADSESSSIRKASMIDGKVMPVAGGDRNPLNLFAFGDADGKLFNAKLQHPLALTYDDVNNRIYVADTYNHKIKVINIEDNIISSLTIKGPDETDLILNEPAGLCVDVDGRKLLVADTNKHTIHLIDLKTLKAQPFSLDFGQVTSTSETDAQESKYLFKDGSPHHVIKELSFHLDKKSTIYFHFRLSQELKFTDEAPQTWLVKTVNQAVILDQLSGTVDNGICKLEVQVVHPDFFCENSNIITIHFSLNICASMCCLIKQFSISLKSNTLSEEYMPHHNVYIKVDRTKIGIK